MDPAGEGLDRFVRAQDADGTYERALAELRAGRKVSHWMWFVFPQLAGLGRSPTSRRYAIVSLGEARAYLEHPLLGTRMVDVRLAAGSDERETAPACRERSALRERTRYPSSRGARNAPRRLRAPGLHLAGVSARSSFHAQGFGNESGGNRTGDGVDGRSCKTKSAPRLFDASASLGKGFEKCRTTLVTWI